MGAGAVNHNYSSTLEAHPYRIQAPSPLLHIERNQNMQPITMRGKLDKKAVAKPNKTLKNKRKT